MATPMSARRSAGPSLTPLPVMATTSPAACRAVMMASFCSGVARANTRARGPARSAAGSRQSITSLPGSHDAEFGGDRVGGGRVVPGDQHRGDSGRPAGCDGGRRGRRAGLWMPIRPSSRSPCSSSFASGTAGRSAAATASTRNPSRASLLGAGGARATVAGSSPAPPDQHDSGAPLQITRTLRPGAGARWSSACGRCRTGISATRGALAAVSCRCLQAEPGGGGQQGRLGGSPDRGPSPVRSAGGRSAASLHSAAAVSSSATSGPAAESRGWPSRSTSALRALAGAADRGLAGRVSAAAGRP